MTNPKPIYDATIYYRTPSGRKVCYGGLVAADTLNDCETILRERLDGEARFGRRRVASVVGEFSASFVTMQIATR